MTEQKPKITKIAIQLAEDTVVMTIEDAKRRLAATPDLLSLSLDSGLSSPGRLHDLFVNLEAMTPGEYKRGAAGMEIRFGLPPSPFGRCLIAFTAFLNAGQR